MKLTTRGRYGIRAIVYIGEHENEKPIPLSQIAKDLELSENYLEQLLRLLKSDGIIASQRGSQGGYFLNRPSSEITLRDLLNSLEGDSYISECVDDSNCKVEKCPTKDIANKIEEAVAKVIDNYTLDDLIKNRLD